MDLFAALFDTCVKKVDVVHNHIKLGMCLLSWAGGGGVSKILESFRCVPRDGFVTRPARRPGQYTRFRDITEPARE